ncbi:hypothetical protein BFW38_01460 [Terasakiispira papahanaumokuakeensis]|uniref:NRDE family protein n=1 Tax=Terasakiispira papahanaumokuakeensis TaxID=197479 RepID=A0A1E2V5Z9_9GAMM|nr:NRDE family protein [Terasakiispira papahanaumokuakeensis]ODC02404.1 hypothetical protein BFW38_01460 [Terasakiispira papahanaumokuakeensis]
MCLLAIAWQSHLDFPLVMAANRDEFHSRPTQPAYHWASDRITGGQDVEAGGSWLLTHNNGRWAALTNFREPNTMGRQPGYRSRGELPLKALEQAPETLASWLTTQTDQYLGYNLIWGDQEQAWWFSNRHPTQPQRLTSGLYILSNAALDTPWPKSERLRDLMQQWLNTPHPDLMALWPILKDRHRPTDDELPDTGIGLEWERLLSTPFIESPEYGTRASTIVYQSAHGCGQLMERSFNAQAQCVGERHLKWSLE